MKIDIRYLLPLIGPFVALGLFRSLWFLAGAEWTDPTVAAVLSLCFGVGGGLVAATALFEREAPIGFIRFGRRKEGGE